MKRLSLGYALSITILLVIGWLLLRMLQRGTALRIRAFGLDFDAIRLKWALDGERVGPVFRPLTILLSPLMPMPIPLYLHSPLLPQSY